MSLVPGVEWFSETGASGVTWHDFVGPDNVILGSVGEYTCSYQAHVWNKGGSRYDQRFPTLEEAKHWVEIMVLTGAV